MFVSYSHTSSVPLWRNFLSVGYYICQRVALTVPKKKASTSTVLMAFFLLRILPFYITVVALQPRYWDTVFQYDMRLNSNKQQSSVGWLIDWLMKWSIDWLVGVSIVWLRDRLLDWHWLIDWITSYSSASRRGYFKRQRKCLGIFLGRKRSLSATSRSNSKTFTTTSNG